jgi:aspartyl-tRNA(Asn)/glutamyl-tRNA(Gln) amidotransferase subunit A
MVTPVDVPKLIPYTLPWNRTGQPALSVPCGFTPSGLPAGLQVVGRPFDEATVLQVGYAYERATGWHEARPELADAGNRLRPAV